MKRSEDRQKGDLESSERSLTERWFGAMSPGGFRSSLFTLCSAMIGVGFLTLPQIGKENGLFPMIFLIVFAGMVSMIGNFMLGRAFRITKGKTYSQISAKVIGRKSSLLILIFLYLYVTVSSGAYYVFGTIFLRRGPVRLELRPQPGH